jgi:glycosyltransferase involved in cell wall biosynthesis
MNCFLYRNFPEHNVSEMDLKTAYEAPIKLFYAGLLGIAQGVLELCEKIEITDLNIELHLFGDGAEKNQIEALIRAQNKTKIIFNEMVDRDVLNQKLNSFDIAIVPLKNRIYGSVPSKIFEYSTLGFPILYFGGGEGEAIVSDNNIGWVAAVEDYNDLNNQLRIISNMNKAELHQIKVSVFKRAQHVFDLEKQLQDLIQAGVF